MTDLKAELITAGVCAALVIALLLVRNAIGNSVDYVIAALGLFLVVHLFVLVIPESWFAPLLLPKEREFRRSLRERSPLDDDAFYERFYAHTEIPPEIPIRVRRELECMLGLSLDRIEPADNIAAIFDDIDFADVLWRLARVFKVAIPLSACSGQIDGTFDSLVRYIAQVRPSTGQ